MQLEKRKHSKGNMLIDHIAFHLQVLYYIRPAD